MEVNWISVISMILLGVSLSTGAAIGYLTLFIDRKLWTQKEQILTHIDEKFALKELMEDWKVQVREDLAEIKSRLDRVEYDNDRSR